MRRWALLLLLSGPGCADRGPAIPDELVELGDPALHDRNGVLQRGGAPLSGYVVERDGRQLLSKTPYLGGKRQGRAYGWYPDGAARYEKLFRDGLREGTHRGWWPNGALQFVYRYEHDLFEGEQVGYYKNGVQAELRHYRLGHEEGQQRTWDGQGRLATNYNFKEGRRYGIVGRFDCVSVHEK